MNRCLNTQHLSGVWRNYLDGQKNAFLTIITGWMDRCDLDHIIIIIIMILVQIKE